MDEVITAMNGALARLNTVTDAETAAVLCGIIFRTGMYQFSPAELIRSIEMRMPAPTDAQAELASITGNKEGLCLMRAVGAFGDKLVCFVPEKPLANGFYFSGDFQVLTCSPDADVPRPAWDILRPAERRATA